MVIYGRPDFSLGKDFPTMGPFKNYRPKIIGPGSGKIKAGIYAGYQIGKFLYSRPWVKGTLTGTVLGTATGLGIDAPGNNNHKTLQQYGKRSNSYGRYKKRRANSSSRYCCCHKRSRRSRR